MALANPSRKPVPGKSLRMCERGLLGRVKSTCMSVCTQWRPRWRREKMRRRPLNFS